MAYNVPDDWNYFYMKCEHCGDCYHLSEGGCGCDAEEEAIAEQEEEQELSREDALFGVMALFRDPYCRIEGTNYQRVTKTHSDDLGDILYANDIGVQVAFIDREGYGQLEFTMSNWLEIKKLTGYGEGDIS